ncbi:hypothetical protein CANARDRAFT_68230 [[Candida] arabinofermentans NRRL YB-2248]|uniref:Peroxisomal ATPase PEX6 n=1 Tax=[Candida] arabinofermentans NRRL YB-2248 TaxID=983967 RepID=A0A1E4SXC3_9ASCO|nr:hypothetical protein CANARDRAFT_68230 [[Candida] arabinofermentans NRRL YB-2248]
MMPGLLSDELSVSNDCATIKSTIPLKVKIQLSLDSQSSLEFISLSKEIYQTSYNDYFENGSISVKDKFVSVKLLGSNLFKESKIYPITVVYDLPSDTIELNSLSFINKYGSNFTLDQAIIQPIDKLIHLDSIMLQVPLEVYQLLENYPIDKLLSILANERECSTDFIILKKFDLSRSLNGEFIHCEPVDQGYIDINTKIVITKQDTVINDNSNNTDSIIDDVLDDDLTIEFSQISLDNIAPSTKPLTLKTSVLTNTTISSHTQLLSSTFTSDDNELFGCLSITNLQQLGCLSGDIIQLNLICDCSSDILCACSTTPYHIRLFPFLDPNDFKSNTIYLSPLLLNTLNNPSQVVLKQLSNHYNKQHNHLTKLTNYVQLAKEVVIARIASPITLDRSLQHLFLSNLKSFFEVRDRVVVKGQMIPIPLDTYLARSIFATYESSGDSNFPSVVPQGTPNDIAWFQITDGIGGEDDNSMIPGQQYLIDSKKTRMIQSGIVSIDLSSIPNMNSIRLYLSLPLLFTYPNNEISTKGAVTFDYAKELRKIISTSFKIQNKVKLQTSILIHSLVRCIGKSSLIRSISNEFGAWLLELDGYELLNSGSVSKTIGTIRGKCDKIVENCSRVIIYIKHIESLAKKQDPNSGIKDTLALKIAELIDEYTSQNCIFIASSNDSDSISEIVRSKLKFEIYLNVPTEQERKIIFESLLSPIETTTTTTTDYSYKPRQDLSINHLALQSAGLTPNDLQSIISTAKNLSYDRMEELADLNSTSINTILASNGGYINYTPLDLESSINLARNKFSDSIGAPRIPNVKWEDVGGLDTVKDSILDTIDMPLKHPELFANGMKKRSGILFYGPPGTGKTLLAKAIATNFALNFFSVKGPELLNMYIGESEANVRRVFQRARDAKPCVIFFDELDSVAPKRGQQGDSGGVMDRIVSQLLAELDGMSDGGGNGEGVFVVGATNRPDLLDEALLRPGRFDKMLYLGIADTHEKQKKILEALTRKFELGQDVNLHEISLECPLNYTGADFYALCSDAMLCAMTRQASLVDSKLIEFNEQRQHEGKEPVSARWWFDNIATNDDVSVTVQNEDFLKAMEGMVASVSREEMEHYQRVRENFEGGKKQDEVVNGEINDELGNFQNGDEIILQ